MSLTGIDAGEEWRRHEEEMRREINGNFEVVCANCGEIRNHSVRPVKCGECGSERITVNEFKEPK